MKQIVQTLKLGVLGRVDQLEAPRVGLLVLASQTQQLCVQCASRAPPVVDILEAGNCSRTPDVAASLMDRTGDSA